MSKKIGLMMVLLLAFFATVSYAAPDRTGKWDFGLNVSAAIPDDSETDTAAYVGGTLSYGVTKWLGVGAEAGWAGFGESDSGINVDEDAVPILGDIILRVPMDSQVQPYAVVGLGAIVWNIDSNVPGLNLDADTGFAAKFGGGFDWFVNDNWIANFEFSYVTSDTDATATFNGASISADNLSADYWTVGGGIKYLFS